jgi:flagellar protein FlaG
MGDEEISGRHLFSPFFPRRWEGIAPFSHLLFLLEDNMAIDISGISAAQSPLADSRAARQRPVAVEAVAEAQTAAVGVDIGAALEELQQVSLAFNRRLSFSLNQKIDTVVVKVIDSQTDKVIKEIPPKELQVVHERIKEAIGLLFDEKI